MTVEDLKVLLNIDLNDNTYDDTLDNIVNASYSLLEKEINYPLIEKTITEKKFGSLSKFLTVKYSPVNSIISVKEYESDGTTLINDITSDIDYQSFNDKGMLYRTDDLIFYQNRIYEIQYTAGFTTTPSDVEYILRQIALSLHSQIDNIKNGVDSISTPDGRFVYRKELITPAMQTIIDKYKKLDV